MNSEDYGNFILYLIESNPFVKNNLNKIVFYFDNASIHKAEIQKPLFNQLYIMYAPPYAPFLNPIENYFGLWKHYFRSLSPTPETFITKIIQAAQKITRKDILGFIILTLKNWIISFRMEDIY